MELSYRLRKKFARATRPVLLTAMGLLIITQIVALTPSSLEEAKTSSLAVDPQTLVQNEQTTLATGIPKGRIPEYTVDQFDFVSSQGTEKQWQLLARRAFLFNSEKLVHAREVKAFLYDSSGKLTVVTGHEAKYFMNQRDLEVFGDVKVQFPDGFQLTSPYLRYRPVARKIEIPSQYPVKGGIRETSGQVIEFDSHGFDFAMDRAEIVLPKQVRFDLLRPTGSEGLTSIQADRCVIERSKEMAHFTMDSGRRLETRFVHITQPTMFARSRRADLHYGDFSKLLRYLTITEDVLIKETAKDKVAEASLRYATGGKADFDSKNGVIVLSEFPQVYQDNDTVTGDVIRLHRDEDVVEVENSNAFSQGQGT